MPLSFWASWRGAQLRTTSSYDLTFNISSLFICGQYHCSQRHWKNTIFSAVHYSHQTAKHPIFRCFRASVAGSNISTPSYQNMSKKVPTLRETPPLLSQYLRSSKSHWILPSPLTSNQRTLVIVPNCQPPLLFHLLSISSVLVFSRSELAALLQVMSHAEQHGENVVLGHFYHVAPWYTCLPSSSPIISWPQAWPFSEQHCISSGEHTSHYSKK